ncbi:unnamed protein product [Effrenium voratum]|nr:unnamed protein product [Effrenium voratum]
MWILSPLLRCARGEPEEDAREPYLGVDQDGLLASQSFIEEFSGTCDVTAEALGPTAGSQHGHLGKAAAPTDVSVTVPKDYMPGTPLRAAGPFGDVNLKPPPGAKAGEVLRFRLGPSIQFRVTVPPWARGGYEARFALDCGEVVSVKVPDGLQPGDSFEVLPPAMMAGRCQARRQSRLLERSQRKRMSRGLVSVPVAGGSHAWCCPLRADSPAFRIAEERCPSSTSSA